MAQRKQAQNNEAKIQQVQSVLSPFLSPFAFLYAKIMQIRRSTYFNAFETGNICISVGNISWGGTGKTMIVDWLASFAEARDLNACILTRGYKSNLSRFPVLVNKRHTAGQVGDEALLLANNHPKVNVLVDPVRKRSAKLALNTLNPNMFILDDGFQHIAIARNLDLVLLHPEDLNSQWNKVQPRGSWREPASALAKASAFLIKVKDKEHWQEIKPSIQKRLAKYGKPVFAFKIRTEGLIKVGNENDGIKNQEEINDRPYILVTGVGRPHQVYDTVTSYLSYPPAEHKIFPDHHYYSFSEALQFGNARIPIICTQKDAVKLRNLAVPNLYYLKTYPEFGASIGTDLRFPAWFMEWWNMQNTLGPLTPVSINANFDQSVSVWEDTVIPTENESQENTNIEENKEQTIQNEDTQTKQTEDKQPDSTN